MSGHALQQFLVAFHIFHEQLVPRRILRDSFISWSLASDWHRHIECWVSVDPSRFISKNVLAVKCGKNPLTLLVKQFSRALFQALEAELSTSLIGSGQLCNTHYSQRCPFALFSANSSHEESEYIAFHFLSLLSQDSTTPFCTPKPYHEKSQPKSFSFNQLSYFSDSLMRRQLGMKP